MHFILFICIFFSHTSVYSSKASYKDAQESVGAYLLPENHAIRPLLDQIFSPGACFSFDALKAAGFSYSLPREHTRLILASHSRLPGYIFKLYLDIQPYLSQQPEYYFWILRIQGAERIRAAIERDRLGHLFKVPRKWIYLLPQSEHREEGYYPKYTIVVEEDMELVSEEENKQLWKSSAVTRELLQALYGLIEEIGLCDCLKPDNIPFSLDGRVAFIDTQSFGKKKIRFQKLRSHLSEENKRIWNEIIE